MEGSSGLSEYVRVKEEPAEPEAEPEHPPPGAAPVHIKEELQNGHHSDSLKEAECVKQETECENEVKEDLSCSDSECGVSEAAMLAGLYTDHEVKDELVLGQECPYRPDVTLVVNVVLLSRMEGSSGLSECVRVKEEPAEPEAEPEHPPPHAAPVHIKEELRNGHHSDSLKEAECVKQETECENEVKEDLSCSDSGCGVSEAAMLAGLYTDHEVKDELVLGQECPYRPDVTLVVNGRVGSVLRDCCVTLERLPHVETLAKRQDTTHTDTESDDKKIYGANRQTHDTTYTDTESDTDELYAREKEPICDLCGESFSLKSDLLKHVMDHIHSPSSAEQEGRGHSYAFDGQWTQEQERALCRKHDIRDCCVRLGRLQHHEALATNDTQYITQTDTESDTEEVHTRFDYEKPTRDLCGESFALKSDLKKHIMIHIHVPTTHHPQARTDRESDTEEKNIDIDCENMYVGRTKQMYEHSEIHAYECDICGKIFQRKNSLKHHIKTHSILSKSKVFKCNNIGEKSYCCETCGKRFPAGYRLNAHIRIHTDIRAYSCDVCKKRFKTVKCLKGHTRIHSDLRPYSCDVCKKRFRYSTNLKRHTRIHSDLRPYSCDLCKKRFRCSTYLKSHTQIHGDIRPYSCDVCKKRFRYSNHLKRHIRIHGDIRPYLCHVCKKLFRTGCDLKKHTRIHTGEKPYTCKICGKSFASNSGLNAHIRTHTAIRPYYCETCGKRFPTRGGLNSHLRTHTDIGPYSRDVSDKRIRT
ncbi:zinc finger protein 271-like [Cydia splendana]|uniref:zinc finger protein 271-like n=1 Tax=Cydia splendana TaxID=1100963 RepID=UPI00300C3967